MFSKYRTDGFVLEKTDRFEADQLFVVYTKDYGRIEVMGKGIRKIASKLRAGADILRFSEIEFIQGKNSKTLTDSLCKNRFTSISSDQKKIAAALGIAGFTAALSKNSEAEERVWDLLQETLFFLEGSPAQAARAIQHSYYWNLLSILGWRPNFENCCVCGIKLEDNATAFTGSEKGIVCPGCAKKFLPVHAIGADIFKLLKMISGRRPAQLGALRIASSQDRALEALQKIYCQAVI